MDVDLKVMDKVGNRRGRSATAKGSETGLQLRRLREKTMVDHVCMPSCLWLGHPSQMGGVDIGCILHRPGFTRGQSVVAGDRGGGAPVPSSRA